MTIELNSDWYVRRLLKGLVNGAHVRTSFYLFVCLFRCRDFFFSLKKELNNMGEENDNST